MGFRATLQIAIFNKIINTVVFKVTDKVTEDIFIQAKKDYNADLARLGVHVCESLALEGWLDMYINDLSVFLKKGFILEQEVSGEWEIAQGAYYEKRPPKLLWISH